MKSQKTIKADANQKFATKISAVAGSLAALAQTPTTANAEIVHVDDQELSLDFLADSGKKVEWDVDGQHGDDFYLSFVAMGRSSSTRYAWLYLNSDNRNGRGFVNYARPADKDINNLPTGFRVGPTLDANYYFGVSGNRQRLMVSARIYSGGSSKYRIVSAEGFTSSVAGFAGFRFDAGGATLYGWARITLDKAAPGTVTIHEWAYEDTGAEIRVGQVPEPHSLALLAMGAAGLATWRTRRNKGRETA